MNIADQLQEIRAQLADDRLIAVLKQMPKALMSPVNAYGIPRQQAPHEGRQAGRSADD